MLNRIENLNNKELEIGEPNMPIITVQLSRGRTIEQKQEFVKSITKKRWGRLEATEKVK